MMPITSYTSVGIPGSTPSCSMPNAMFTPSMLTPPGQPQQLHPGPGPQQSPVQQQHQQQQLVFSGASGNFFLAQSSAVGASPMGTPVMLAPGQGNPGGTFMVAQPVPQSAVPGASIAASAPPNCIIRLPDGRLVMPATAPTPVGFSPSAMSRLPTGPTAYYSVPMTSGTPVSANPSQQPQPTAGLVNPNPGQAFFIQVPSNPGSGFGGTMITTVSTASSMSFQSQPHQSTGLLKPAQALSCVGSSPFQTRHPVLMPVAVSSPQTPCIMSPKTSGTSSPNTINATTNQPGNPTLVQCTAPASLDAQLASPKLCSMVGVSSAPVQNFQSLAPSGMAVARLPNGTYTTLAYSRPQTPTNVQANCTTPGGNAPMPSMATNPTVGSGPAQRKSSVSARSNPRPRLPASPASVDSGEVLRRLDEQIALHQNTPNPNEMQSAKLKQLIEARNQLAKTMATTGNTRQTDSPNTTTTTGNRRQSCPQTPSISPSLRRELLNMLAKNNLLPASVNPTSAETFVVEFRLNQQQYRLRLTRAQKTDMERLLYSVRSQRQAEILTVLQQEQNRFMSSRPRIAMAAATPTTSIATTSTTASPGMFVAPNPSVNIAGISNPNPAFGPTPTLVSQPMRLQGPIQSFAPTQPNAIGMQTHAFGQAAAPGLRLVATRPVLQPATGMAGSLIRGTVNPSATGLCTPAGAPVGTNNAAGVSTAPVMGVVTALAMSPMTAQGSGTPIFASNLGPTGATTVVPHAVSALPVSGPAVVPGTMGSNNNSNTGTAGPGLFLSSFPPSLSGSQTFVMQQSVMVPSSTGPMSLPANCALIQQSPTPTQSTSIQPIPQSVGTPQAAPPSIQPAQPQQSHIQPQQSHVTASQPIRTPTPIQAAPSPPTRAVLGLSLQQAARLSRMRACLSHDLKASVEKPSLDMENMEKPPLPTELLQTLASYHVLRDADNTEEALNKVEKVLDTSIALLFERKRQTIRAVDALLFRQTMEQLQPPVEDRLLLAQMALDLDRDVLASERQDFSEVLAESEDDVLRESKTNFNGDAVRKIDSPNPATDRKGGYLRHATSVLSPAWQSMLGPLAFLRPLVFDSNGRASYASLDLPATENDSQSPMDESKYPSDTHENGSKDEQLLSSPGKENADQASVCIPNDDGDNCVHRQRPELDEDDVDVMSDDVEADLLLGLGTRQSRGSVGSDPMGVTNGSYACLHAGQQRGGSVVGVSKRSRDKCVAFEETYNLWQELMREEGMDMDMGENGEDDGGIGADTLDASLDSAPGSMIPENSGRNPLRTPDNGPGGLTVGMQHSEDPDIDAAIRSILSTTN
ncbi:unnamed protein product [Echinostoma caproni]|uniref:GLTSCR protein conserved domain-containing protein n=1 Tax=Echinostoma caproni TaxID=27848 RepID=A0A183AFJ2_9TREM|nr:unnamed protein product [Echinostoma caproni]